MLTAQLFSMDFESLVDDTQPFNVLLLDAAVQAFYEGDPAVHKRTEAILTKFQNHPDSWRVVDQILRQSQSVRTKFLALRILETFVVVRWNTLPIADRLVIRNFIVEIIVELSSRESTMHSERIYLNKLDMVLVQILKKDWPQYWPTFISEIVEASQTNPSLCENSMRIIRLLSEEIFDFSSDQMTLTKMRKLKTQMMEEFGDMLELCQRVLLSDIQIPSLIQATLETVSRFLGWIPASYVFRTDLIKGIQPKLFQTPNVRNIALQCFLDIISSDCPSGCEPRLTSLFETVMELFRQTIPPEAEIVALYEIAKLEDQDFIQKLTLFFTTFLENHRAIAEQVLGLDIVFQAHLYLLRLSQIQETDIWKICLDYWGKIAYDIQQQLHRQEARGILDGYKKIFVDLRRIIMERMVTPDEVLIVQNDEGEIVREYVKQSDNAALYTSIRHVVCLLTIMDPEDTEVVIRNKFAKAIHTETWRITELNKVCWYIGSISGAMDESREDLFLTGIMRDLVQLADNMKYNVDNELAIVSCILYIAGQHPRFLKAHKEFMDYVMAKAFELIHSPQIDIRDLSSDGLLKFCQGCREAIVQDTADSIPIWLERFVTALPELQGLLNIQQLCIVYEAMGYIISGMTHKQQQEACIDLLMKTSREACKTVFNSPQNQNDTNTLKWIIDVLKINNSVCQAIGPIYASQFHFIFQYLPTSYHLAVNNVQHHKETLDSGLLKLSRRIKQEALTLIDTFISSLEHLDNMDGAFWGFYNELCTDYQQCPPPVREVAVINLTSNMLEKPITVLRTELLDLLWEKLFQPTLFMVNQNFVDFPDHRIGFYKLLRGLTKQYLEELLRMPTQALDLLIDSLLWGIKHTAREISHVALQTCLQLINKMAQLEDEDVASAFYERYFVRILQDVLVVLLDPDCRNAFNYQSQLLARMLELVQEGEIYTRIYDPSTVGDSFMSNAAFLQNHVRELLTAAFPLLQKNQIEVLVLGMFEYSGDLQRFQDDIRDFLIDIKEVSDDVSDLQGQEEEAELELLRQL
ncbi:Crm1-F1 [Radiomyces spectabilis]|uniref:Crm1-F1 n=1 Tax=Radiomyces spectabilis TaxID=64574 RepID=UPI00221FB0CF|nr:Crm1-F1 [Radiomyces spectabilis]KAI8370327.1 Crm1-F1 [Radiomyces spectabilis]